MDFINNLKIKNKLILMIILPIAGLFYFSLNGIWEKSTISGEMGSLQTLSGLAVRISPLIHEIQKERGMTLVFIESKGTKFTFELPGQRSETDKKIMDLQTFLKGFDINRFGVEFKETLDSALKTLDDIKSRRESASAMNVPADEMFEYYTYIITSSLDVIAHISKLSGNAEISTMTAAYISFLQGKERVGRERALLSNAFATDRFEPGALNKYIYIIAEQNAYTSVFLSFATSDQKDFYKKKIQGKSIDEVARIRKIALEMADSGGFGVDPHHWFKMATGKIELLKEVEDKLSTDLNLKAVELKTSAQYALIFFIVVMIIAVLTSFLSAYLVIGAITTSLGMMVESSQKISTGDLNVTVETSSKDEVGNLANSFKEMTSNLREAFKKIKKLSINVDTAVKRIEDSASSIKRGSEEQAATMTDISVSVKELHKIAIDVANSTEQFLKLSEDTASSVQKMTLSIDEVDGNVADLAVAVENTSTSIEEIANSLKEVAGGTDNISKGADEIASSLIQIDTSAMEIERYTREGVDMSNEVASNGEKSVNAVELTHAGMEKVKEEIKLLAMVIDILGQKSKEIGKILNIIHEVTDQTRLLALNAAIIAAQAGEHEKGFSVVADEIKNLADRTAVSTKEIESIITGIKKQTEKAVVSVVEAMAKVSEGERLSMKTIELLKGIMERFKASQDMSLKIAKATQEQTKGSRKVIENMESITNTIHYIAKATQEQSHGGIQIVKAVEKMKDFISHIKKITAEQSGGSKVIAHNTKNMIKFMQEINAVSSNHEKKSQRIAAAVIDTTTIAGAEMKNAGELEEVVDVLKKETRILKEWLERFNLE